MRKKAAARQLRKKRNTKDVPGERNRTGTKPKNADPVHILPPVRFFNHDVSNSRNSILTRRPSIPYSFVPARIKYSQVLDDHPSNTVNEVWI